MGDSIDTNMGNTENSIQAEVPPTDNPSEQNTITDVYIGVFFDGTNNNMLWATEKHKAYLKKLHPDVAERDYDEKAYKKAEEAYVQAQKNYNEAKGIKKKHASLEIYDELKNFINYQLSSEEKEKLENQFTKTGCTKCSLKEIDQKCEIKQYIFTKTGCTEFSLKENDLKKGEKIIDQKCEIKQYIEKKYKNEILRFKNAHTKHKPNKYGSYSNIAILYSTYSPVANPKKICYNVYVEGSGATDISHSLHGNINGLGFGLGKTGVVALVSKSIFYITNFINSIKGQFDTSVNIHFQIYGFSRGSACSRLLAYLVTRDSKERLGKREKEFADFYAKESYCSKKDGNSKEKDDSWRIDFLEAEKGKTYNKTVDFLGIYDTVVSIGFLKQKDGFVHPLRLTYVWPNYVVPNNVWHNNYKDNWHYKNVNEYGMYSTSSEYTHSDKIKHICHICAMDEYRENFALTDIGKKVGKNAVEIFIPGCHSDVGGGYYDGDEEQEIMLKKYIVKNNKEYHAVIVKTIEKIGDDAKDQIKKIGDDAKDQIKKIGDDAKDQIKKIGDDAKDQIKKIKPIINIQINKIDTVVKDLCDKINKSLENKRIDDINVEIKATINRIEITINNQIDEIGEKIKGQIDKTSNLTMHCIDDIEIFVNDLIDKTKKITTNIINSIPLPMSKRVYISDFPYEDCKEEDIKEQKANLFIGETSLGKAGWIDPAWKEKILRKKIPEKNVPYTIRVVESPRSVRFKRNVKAGYSNIPLQMMRDYAELCLCQNANQSETNKSGTNKSDTNEKQFESLFEKSLENGGKTIFDTEYPVPNDLSTMKEEMLNEVLKLDKKGKRCWLHPNEEEYKKLRMKYLHFTSTTQDIPLSGHLNNPLEANLLEGGPGNIANTPNFDLDGRLCRIIYHGDKNDNISFSDMEYMYNYNMIENTVVNNDISCNIKLYDIIKIDKDNDIMKYMC